MLSKLQQKQTEAKKQDFYRCCLTILVYVWYFFISQTKTAAKWLLFAYLFVLSFAFISVFISLFNYDKEEWAWAKDQLSKFGTGQSQTEYLKAHRESEKQKQQN